MIAQFTGEAPWRVSPPSKINAQTNAITMLAAACTVVSVSASICCSAVPLETSEPAMHTAERNPTSSPTPKPQKPPQKRYSPTTTKSCSGMCTQR